MDKNKAKLFAHACRRVVAEGFTLLESDGALPFCEGEEIALFGRAQVEYFKSGTGSGGRVNCDYVTNVGDELAKRVKLEEETKAFFENYIKENPFDEGDGWQNTGCQKQPFLDEEMVGRVAKKCKKAVFVLNRACGESYDCPVNRGNWYLSEEEEQSIAVLAKHFEHLIVLINSGNLMDLAWIKKYGVGTVAYIWQGGQEGGRGTVDVLMGDATPGGRLADTVAIDIDDYPAVKNFGDEVKNVHVEDIYVGYRYFETFAKDRVLYPFGHGLTYTSFDTETLSAKHDGGRVTFSVKVTNVGDRDGKEVVQVYYGAPMGKMGKSARELVAFKKTGLLAPAQSEVLELEAEMSELASYDDSGVSGYPFAYVLEAGEYSFYIGKNVRDAKKELSVNVAKTVLVRQCKQALAPVESFKKMAAKNGETPVLEDAHLAEYDFCERVRANLPHEIPYTGDRGISLRDVGAGKYTLEEFVAQLDKDDLMCLVRGEGMSSPKGSVTGSASCFGGLTERLFNMGIPIVTTCDGPSGIRMESTARATCIPSGTLISATFAPELLDDMFDCLADEMTDYGIDVILGPGVNIHRSPLCGRNFEYYSEDPRLTGAFATKFCERLTKKGVFATVKHFAVNSQETNRNGENEVLTERALREIYLKPYEMAVKSGYTKSIMSSYNRINGRSVASQYDLMTTILRDDWGYTGMVMTDWWPQMDAHDASSYGSENIAEMVKAQNDVFMVVDDTASHKDNMPRAYESGLLTLGELQRCVKNILGFVMQTLAYRLNRKSEFDNLSVCDELVLERYASEVEPKIAVLEDGINFIGNKIWRIPVEVKEDAFYCAEIIYAIDTDSLSQYTMQFSTDGKSNLKFVCRGTEGKTAEYRIKTYLKKDSFVVFADERIKGIRIYKLK